MRAFLALLAVALATPANAGNWISFHGDELNTGFQAGGDYQVYQDVWWNRKLAATQIEGSAAVKDGVLVIGAWDNVLRAFDAESGAERWNATFGAKIYATPAISTANRVYAVDSAGTLKAFDLEKGTVLGTAAVGATLASPVIHEGKIFLGNEAGEMRAFDTETLTPLWTFSVASLFESVQTTLVGNPPNQQAVQTCVGPIPAGQIRGKAAVYSDKVIFGSRNHWMYAIDEEGNPGLTTFPHWIFKTEDIVVGAPMVDASRGRVTLGSYDGSVYSLPASPPGAGPIQANGQPCTALRNVPAWTFNVPSDIGDSKVHSSAATDGARIFVGANNGRVYALDAQAGTKLWDFATGGAVTSSPSVSNQIVVVGSDDGKVYWLDAASGALQKDFLIGSSIKSSPALDGSRAYVASFEGDLYMFGPTLPPRPDLQVASITYSGSEVVVRVENAGGGNASASKLRISIDGSLAADIDVPALASGESFTARHVAGLAPGAHTVDAQADQASAVTEAVESNNARSEPVSVAEPTPPPGGGGGGGKRKDTGIPGPALPLVLAGLALAALARRRGGA